MSKYLFFDIDGTLISDKTKTIPQSALEAISKAIAEHKVFYCTGRSYGMVEELSYTNIHNAVICNGAGIVVNDELVQSFPIHKDIVEKTLQSIEDNHGGYQIIDVNNGYQNQKTYDTFAKRFIQHGDTPVEDAFKRRHMKHADTYQGTPILKIDFEFDKEDDTRNFLKTLDPSLNAIQGGGYQKQGGFTYGEIVLKGVSKGTGIQHMLDYFHASIDDSFGFGDSSNDIDMLKTVNTAIVVKDATEDALQYADYVTDSVDHDGIKNALKHFNLID